MWYKNFPSVRDDENYVERKLINEKSYISLLFFQSGVGRAKEAEGIIIQSQEESRTLTLTYLQDLLERGEVKVGYYHGGNGIAEEYLGTPKEIITQIKAQWNITKPGVLNCGPEIFESDVHIVLKDTPWPVWR